MKAPWMYLTTVEALAVAKERGVDEAQAKADIIRGLEQGARKIDGTIVGFVIASQTLRDGSFRVDPVVDFDRSEMMARPRGSRGTWDELTPRRQMVKFWIARVSIDWLWPEQPKTATSDATARPVRGRAKTAGVGDALIVEEAVRAIVAGQFPSARAAAQHFAAQIPAASEEAAQDRLRKLISAALKP